MYSMYVRTYVYVTMYIFFCFMQKDFIKYQSPGSIVRALVLSLSVCYHARLHRREKYVNKVVKFFTGPITLPGGAKQFRDEIRWYVCTYLHTYISC